MTTSSLPSFHKDDAEGIRAAYAQSGFVIVDDLIPPNQLEGLIEASDSATEKGRTQQWSDIRAVGKQFPPWKPSDDVWGIQALINPALEENKIFEAFYGSEDLLNVSAVLMNCTRDEMKMGLFNLLINPLKSDFKLAWHRDMIKATVTPEEEAEQLKIKHYGIQWNLALYDDTCLEAIPASHRRVRSPEERAANLSEDTNVPMPGGATVFLKAGQCVFYNNNIVHRGIYQPTIKRRTLHGSYSSTLGDADEATKKASGSITQHHVEWMRPQSFCDQLSSTLQPLWQRLMHGQEQKGWSVQYAQDL